MTTENEPHLHEAQPDGTAPATHPGLSADPPADAEPKRVPDLPWMKVPTQRGMRPTPGPEGLRLEQVDVGDYGYAPDVWPYKNDLPRGAYPAPNQGSFPQASYSIYEKYEVWSDNSAALYEDAIRDRWASATDIPWETLQPLPETVERAICQICTELSEQAYVTVGIFSAWLERISYGFHEVKNYLATQIYDNARHVEAFRKRTVANGGGVGVESPGIYNKALTSSMKFTELVVLTNIVRATANLVFIETLKSVTTSEADHTLCTLVARDLRRHIAFGTGHLNFVLGRRPDLLPAVHTWLTRGEFFIAADQRRDTPLNEAFILLFGGGEQGREKLAEMRRTWLAYYLNRLADGRIVDRMEKLSGELTQFLPEGADVPPTVALRPSIPDPTFV